ncbi:hypothetical protein MLD38_019680 [Melastoma candidum]|uniref:Uncharacterized protein n=1 Tax=Melastoma candidum TaxID=119954 RepID=A0ACB9QZ23_9MYRT|nr:hypothetical protein MLD38_019680 [Melastoma candidum]
MDNKWILPSSGTLGLAAIVRRTSRTALSSLPESPGSSFPRFSLVLPNAILLILKRNSLMPCETLSSSLHIQSGPNDTFTMNDMRSAAGERTVPRSATDKLSFRSETCNTMVGFPRVSWLTPPPNPFFPHTHTS